MWKIHDKEFCEYLAYNILCGYIVFNDKCGYGVLEHPMGCLVAYVLWYYCKLEVAYNKYYLEHMTIVSHKLIFVMAKRDPILNTIEKRVKDDSMETRLWAQRFGDLFESCAFKGVLKETMMSISWCCRTKGPNLHVIQAHLKRGLKHYEILFFYAIHLVR
jgi:hypothetical protein